MIHQTTSNQCDSQHEIEASDQIPHPLRVVIKCHPSHAGKGVKCPGYAWEGGGGCWSFDLTGTLWWKVPVSFSYCWCKTIHVSRACDPSGLRQESRALGVTILGMCMKAELNRMGRIRLFPLFFQNGCSQSSRFLLQARRIVGSGDENDARLAFLKFNFHLMIVLLL